jgi:hypothetical protein
VFRLALLCAAATCASIPPAVFAPAKLAPLPAYARDKCRAAHDLGLCPARLPRAWLPRDEPPDLAVQLFRYRDGGGRVVQLSFGYGAPVELEPPTVELWRNRPCCFLHFDLYRRLSGPALIPDGARPVVFAGKVGLLTPAYGYNMGCGPENRGVYFCNHVRFAWRQNGTWYAATLHNFGPGTQTLLARLIRELRPVA